MSTFETPASTARSMSRGRPTPLQLRHNSCGRVVRAVAVCSHCGDDSTSGRRPRSPAGHQGGGLRSHSSRRPLAAASTQRASRLTSDETAQPAPHAPRLGRLSAATVNPLPCRIRKQCPPDPSGLRVTHDRASSSPAQVGCSDSSGIGSSGRTAASPWPGDPTSPWGTPRGSWTRPRRRGTPRTLPRTPVLRGVRCRPAHDLAPPVGHMGAVLLAHLAVELAGVILRGW
jgi:hypothetical protein